jgi:hypothetical protein
LATAGSWAATRCACVATYAVICRDEVLGSAVAQNGATPVGSVTGSANGSPPSGSVFAASQSQSAFACGVVAGAASAIASNA